MKKIIVTAIALLTTSAAFAFSLPAAMFQAGSIEDGKSVTIGKKSGVASYFQDGKSGYVTFNCNLNVDASNSDAAALLWPGKNFANSQNAPLIKLVSGKNGPYIWHLSDEGESNGNIRIQYVSNGSATLQCQGVYTAA